MNYGLFFVENTLMDNQENPWYLPSRQEIESFMLEEPDPETGLHLASIYKNSKSAIWTCDSHLVHGDWALIAALSKGEIRHQNKNVAHQVRLVREQRNDAGEHTGRLELKSEPEHRLYTWYEAMSAFPRPEDHPKTGMEQHKNRDGGIPEASTSPGQAQPASWGAGHLNTLTTEDHDEAPDDRHRGPGMG